LKPQYLEFSYLICSIVNSSSTKIAKIKNKSRISMELPKTFTFFLRLAVKGVLVSHSAVHVPIITVIKHLGCWLCFVKLHNAICLICLILSKDLKYNITQYKIVVFILTFSHVSRSLLLSGLSVGNLFLVKGNNMCSQSPHLCHLRKK